MLGVSASFSFLEYIWGKALAKDWVIRVFVSCAVFRVLGYGFLVWGCRAQNLCARFEAWLRAEPSLRS